MNNTPSTPLSDAELGRMLRDILSKCPEFSVFPKPKDPRLIEVTAVYANDLVPERMATIQRTLERLSALSRHINRHMESEDSHADS